VEPPAQAPIVVDGYRVLRKIGEGGVAQVYLADHPGSARQRVLKLVPLCGGDDGVVRRFVQEYALLMQIDDANVARVFQHGQEDTHAYMAMEYFPGGDLRGLMRRGCSAEMAVTALLQIAGGLAAVHKIGVVHRDLKPENIMIRDDGSLAIADFGIAKRMGDAHGPTRHGDVLGTPYYLSPEQALGIPADHRADIYSLGVMFYEMLAGKRAYTADSAMGLLHQHAQSPVPVLDEHLADYQPLVERMMCKDVEGRFASAVAIIEFARAAGLAG
jgi:serine/threonine protein kinase